MRAPRADVPPQTVFLVPNLVNKKLPMEELDKRDFVNNVLPDEEELLMNEVIQNDTDLYYLHHYLTEVFRKGEI